MAASTSFHFQVVGDDHRGNQALLKRFATGRHFEVDGNLCNIRLSLFQDPTERTVTLDHTLGLPETIDGYIFMYNVSDTESFHRLYEWFNQIDMFNEKSIFEEPKVLLGNVSSSGERDVEFDLVLGANPEEAFAAFAKMKYFEADLAEDTIGAEKAISSLVSTRLPPATTKPQVTRKIFLGSRANTIVGRNDKAITLPATTSRRRSQTVRHPHSSSKDSTHTNCFSFNSEEFGLLSKTMMDLNMTVARMPSLNLNTDDMKQEGAESGTGNTANPLARFSRVATEASVYLKAAREKIESLRTASNEMFGALKERVEELHETIDVLKANNRDLCQELDEANDRNEHVQKEIDELRKGLKDSSHWIVGKEEVELTSKKLGDGGYGTVTVANFRGAQVAAKQLHGMILTSYNRGMFDREMNIASKVRHPNCVQFLGAVVEEEPIILMELMPTVLREIIPKELNRLSQDQIPPICRDIARALTYLHSMKPQPVIHRDVSSANVLLEPVANSLWKAKISDYGSANFATLVNTKAPGNAVYAAPEACSVKLQSTKMDVFSFGVLVVEIYLREFPDPNSRDEMVYQMELMYPQIASLIKKCLCEEPEDRLDMFEILQQLK